MGAVNSNLQKLFFMSDEDDYQFLEKSWIPTHHFQDSLPRLPIPELEDTCSRYLMAVRPLLNDSQYQTTQEIVTQFQQGVGKVLQEELVAEDRENKHSSYVARPWGDMYMTERRPVVLTTNPIIVFNDDPRAEYNNQLIRATNMLISSIRFMKSLRAGILEPDVYHLNASKSNTMAVWSVMGYLPTSVASYVAYYLKAFPLDMSQYRHLFNSTRLPGVGKDELFCDASAKHILVMRNGHFYVFDVLDKDGRIIEPAYIHACLAYIQADDTPAPEYPLGVLTAADRDTWARLRQRLVDLGNESDLNLIDTAIYNLILEDWGYPDDPEYLRTKELIKSDQNTEDLDDLLDFSDYYLENWRYPCNPDLLNYATKRFLCDNAANRWYDKSFSIIINKDGYCALNFEHSWGDGISVVRLLNEIQKDSTEKPRVHPSSLPAQIQPEQYVRRLGPFKMDSTVQRGIRDVAAKHKERIKDIQVSHLEYRRFGKGICRKNQLSPDCIFQLAFQIAIHGLTGKHGSVYEACSTQAFKCGRTETVRSFTAATKECVEAFNKNVRPPATELRKLIERASKAHKDLVKEAAMGQGFDRHLFSLHNLAKRKEMETPELFTDVAYTTINRIAISTSTLTSQYVWYGAFAPSVSDGFGIGYMSHEMKMGCCIVSYSSETDGNLFKDNVRRALSDIKAVIVDSSTENEY